jgi:hypothetical protein
MEARCIIVHRAASINTQTVRDVAVFEITCGRLADCESHSA